MTLKNYEFVKFIFWFLVQQLGYCLQVAGVIRPDLIFGYTIGTNWELPTTENFDFRFYKKKAEVVHRRHRRELYAKLEPILTTLVSPD